jgi:hypothetical protein
LGIQASVSLIALRSLANVFAILIDDVWEDKEKAAQIIQIILPQLVPLLDIHGVENLEHVRAVSVVLSSLSLSKVLFSILLRFLTCPVQVQCQSMEAGSMDAIQQN